MRVVIDGVLYAPKVKLETAELCKCGGESYVIDSRVDPVTHIRSRRRACNKCGLTWRSIEVRNGYSRQYKKDKRMS